MSKGYTASAVRDTNGVLTGIGDIAEGGVGDALMAPINALNQDHIAVGSTKLMGEAVKAAVYIGGTSYYTTRSVIPRRVS